MASTPSQSFGQTLSIIAIALGVGVAGALVFDFHGHRCTTCGRTWHHLGAFNGGDRQAHACSSCGAEQWWKRGHEPLPEAIT